MAIATRLKKTCLMCHDLAAARNEGLPYDGIVLQSSDEKSGLGTKGT